MTTSPGDCTVLVTDNIRRTAKFLCAIGKGLPIVSHRWLLASKNAKMFLGNKNFYVLFYRLFRPLFINFYYHGMFSLNTPFELFYKSGLIVFCPFNFFTNISNGSINLCLDCEFYGQFLNQICKES